jgi:uncharacterized protein YukE
MLDGHETVANIDAKIASLEAEMTALWNGPIKASYKAKVNAITDAVAPRCEANRLLRLVQTDPSFQNETAYARAYRYVKDANEAIKEAFDAHAESLREWEALKEARDEALRHKATFRV